MSLGCMQDVTSPTTQMQWYEEYFELLDDVSEQISTLTPTMLKTSFFHHREETLALKMCLIISLTAAAELHRLLAYQHPESRVRCVDVVFEIVAVSVSGVSRYDGLGSRRVEDHEGLAGR